MTEHEILTREVPLQLPDGDGRTIEARIVPYDEPAEVADPPTYVPYQEKFAAGAFDKQINAASRVKVWLNFEHQPGLQGIVGHGVQIEDRQDGLYGTFAVHDNPDGDKALRMVRDGLLTGLSMEFASLKARTVGGVVERLRAHLDRVSLCRIGAYAGAQVLAVREPPPPLDDQRIPPVPDELLASLRKHGVNLGEDSA